ncbi:MAG: HAMP domain-containing histidine kinase [Candidatus Coatesbacteria bacterium]|nr:MAG: HAMP domain-containing histidine kinase [Candidatus Coatesbacteria bacterium]
MDRKTTSPVATAENPSPRNGSGAPSDDPYTLINSLAHEIRNPLNALALNLHLLGREIGDGPGADKVAAALNEVNRLDNLVTAFLRFSRRKDPDPREVDLRKLLAELETFVLPVASQHGVTLVLADVPDAVLVTDADVLKQALLNVILNSFEAGADLVEIHVGAAPEEIQILVRDDGPGFAEPDRAFEPFYSTKEDGSGLGLPTSRALVRSLGGELRLGEPPAGAEVVLTLPRPAA